MLRLRERVTVNHDVAGSSPAGGAISFNQKGNSQKDHKILWSFCYLAAIFIIYIDCRVQNIEAFFQWNFFDLFRLELTTFHQKHTVFSLHCFVRLQISTEWLVKGKIINQKRETRTAFMLTLVRVSFFLIPDFSIHRNTTSDRNSEMNYGLFLFPKYIQEESQWTKIKK